MAWRRGEIWLDTDALWLGDRSSGDVASLALHAPSFFGLAPAAGMPLAPTGLTASRRRRAELRRRRSTRKTRAAALVIGPTMMLTVAGPRPGAASRADGVLLEDPPSLTLRLGRDGPAAVEESPPPLTAGRAAAGTAPGEAGGPQSTPAPETPSYPSVRWRPGTARGLPYAGSLTGGTQLPVEGADWVTWNPVGDSVPNQPWRLYGTERTIRTVISVLAAHRAAHPDAPRVVVGDISFRGGGPMNQHRSHQNGLDVDVYYPRLDRALRAPVRTAQVDRKLAQDLLDRFVAAGAQIVFVGYSTGLRGPSGVVVPYPNHEDHMHVRFRKPAG
jgi:hypothetical protein